MRRIEVVSRTFAWVAYAPEQRLLKLGFHGGKIYEYFDVPSPVYVELLRADSKGRYFNLHIRNHFRSQQVPAASSASLN